MRGRIFKRLRMRNIQAVAGSQPRDALILMLIQAMVNLLMVYTVDTSYGQPVDGA